MTFRLLKPDEIDVRIGQVNGYGVSFLLYKNARVDMNILDETVGTENWQREHYEVKGNLFCRVGIFFADPENPRWVWKSDCGTESNMEKEKGEASDSFKRACFNFGIGRELYTAPRIILWGKQYVQQDDRGRWTLKDEYKRAFMSLKVKAIEYNDSREITKLVIIDKDGIEVFKDERNS